MDYNITYRKKDKGIQYIISYKDSSGKWKQKSKQGFDKMADAKRVAKIAAGKLEKELSMNIEINHDYDNTTFKEFADMFVEHEKLYKENNTIITYKTAISSFTDLNKIGISKIKSIDIQKCIDKLTKNNLKNITIKRYLAKLSLIFDSAKNKYKIIAKNPVANIDVPKTTKVTEKRALTQTELDDLLSKIKDKKYHLISLIAAKCGLRIGEIMGLTWDNIDEKSSIIKVTQQWKRLKNGSYGMGSLKSKNSYREVPMPPKVLGELLKYESDFPLNINKRIFNNANTSTIAVTLGSLYKRIGYNISIHELRHTYATLLIANGIDFKTVAKLMGHDVEQTIKTYSHVTNDMINNAAKIINKIF